MLNRLASLAMSTRVSKALPGKLDIKRHYSLFTIVIISMLGDWTKESWRCFPILSIIINVCVYII